MQVLFHEVQISNKNYLACSKKEIIGSNPKFKNKIRKLTTKNQAAKTERVLEGNKARAQLYTLLKVDPGLYPVNTIMAVRHIIQGDKSGFPKKSYALKRITTHCHKPVFEPK